MPIKFLLLGGGGGCWVFRRGGWKCQFYFMGVGIFRLNLTGRLAESHQKIQRSRWQQRARELPRMARLSRKFLMEKKF